MTCKTAWEIESSFGERQDGPFGPEGPDPKSVMPNTNANERLTTTHKSGSVDHSLPNIDKFVGFNPYDTGVLQTKVLPVK